jgi:hypothetical protein
LNDGVGGKELDRKTGMAARKLIVKVMSFGICLAALLGITDARACIGHRPAIMETERPVRVFASQGDITAEVSLNGNSLHHHCRLQCCGKACCSGGHAIQADAQSFDLDEVSASLFPHGTAAPDGVAPPGIRRPPRG